jgi:hypothetical protein
LDHNEFVITFTQVVLTEYPHFQYISMETEWDKIEAFLKNEPPMIIPLEAIRLLVEENIMRMNWSSREFDISGHRWGISYRGDGDRLHTEQEIAVHECGHASCAMALGFEFEYIQLDSGSSVMTQSRMEQKDLAIQRLSFDEQIKYTFMQSVTLAGGPIATSLYRYKEPTKWEWCGNDVVMIAITELGSPINIEIVVPTAIKILQATWDVVIGMAEELKRCKRLTYQECQQIAERIDPIPRSMDI